MADDRVCSVRGRGCEALQRDRGLLAPDEAAGLGQPDERRQDALRHEQAVAGA